MTNREKEIFELIRKNPMISQQEIADTLGIARSSVAVHIGNLIKKGYIKGKGYILKEERYVTVIGGTNIDIQGFTRNKLVMKDSNPGKVRLSLGGVGRNIAENLVKLGVPVKLLSVVGDDVYGKKIIEECRLAGIDMDNMLILNDKQTSTYLSILDETGDMRVAISDMDIFQKLNSNYITEKSHLIKNSEVVIIDTNIPKDTIEYLITNFGDKVFFLDTVSTTKAKKVKDMIGKFHTIKPNRLEAEILSDIKIENINDAKKASVYFLERGVKRVFITLGKEGVYYADEGCLGIIRPPKINVINATGAGDAFMAALVYSYIHKFDVQKSAKYGIFASLLALSHENTINPNMSVEKINELKGVDKTC
ncbi:PfkB family carbohydrate kinase [Caldisalinibacter kiritimatiensis]|uniref:Pseudouridine kinase n=1 Tax=Caldisalinibacter kiritimatiensis TaxID=1304284 RepID=R1AVJ9_9FIRM|nr:PfkB family carbohydrate kinase [Caldisalinibacter kiritimatiensis]EOD00687.1 Pseudouridine kinase [Caldisalinibacter kiritimatiensis]